MLEKSFEITMSHKLPTGDIVSVRFGTTATADTTDGSALFDQVYKDTMNDIKKKIKKDKLIRTAYKGIQRGIKAYETEQEALAELENL